jgi:hypothetical protein
MKNSANKRRIEPEPRSGSLDAVVSPQPGEVWKHYRHGLVKIIRAWNKRESVSPQRIQLSRKAGWKMPPNTVKVSRPTKWGNPFKVTPERSQISAVGAFNTWLTVEGCDAGLGEKKKWILEHIHDLKGKNLACFCHENQACHADILLRLANSPDQR